MDAVGASHATRQRASTTIAQDAKNSNAANATPTSTMPSVSGTKNTKVSAQHDGFVKRWRSLTRVDTNSHQPWEDTRQIQRRTNDGVGVQWMTVGRR
eukprot:scaffold106002_cov34-Cyclotella_meneghiniana.AAC.2